jgi:hypothetical protein
MGKRRGKKWLGNTTNEQNEERVVLEQTENK